MLTEADEQTRHTLRVPRHGLDLATLARPLAARARLAEAGLRSGRRTTRVS